MSVTINGSGTITSSTGTLGFGDENLTTTGTLDVAGETDFSQRVTIDHNDKGWTRNGNADDLVIMNAGSVGINILGDAASGQGRLLFGNNIDSSRGGLLYVMSTDVLTISTADADAITIGATQNVTFAGDLDVSAGTGITFDSGSNHLDDYEEGTVVATITPGTSGTITLNASYDELQYTKVGNICHIQGQLITTSVSSPVGSNIQINLPFTAVSGLGKRPSISITSFGLGGGATYAVHPNLIVEAGAILYIYLDASTIQASDQFYIGGSYTTA